MVHRRWERDLTQERPVLRLVRVNESEFQVQGFLYSRLNKIHLHFLSLSILAFTAIGDLQIMSCKGGHLWGPENIVGSLMTCIQHNGRQNMGKKYTDTKTVYITE